jgi:dTDP-4-dehydrorhamnose 3,5-epimerase
MEARGRVTTPPWSPSAIAGAGLFTPSPFRDERGWFGRVLDLAWCEELGLETSFVHHNQSRSVSGVLRGLHVRGGLGEAKIVRCSRGVIVDHIVDTRPWSPTFRHTQRYDLDGDEAQSLYLPPHVAHGFQVVSADADVCYLHTQPYDAAAEIAIVWDDPAFGLEWPILPPVLSARDAAAPRLEALDLDRLLVSA